jgi:hypothetical protein
MIKKRYVFIPILGFSIVIVGVLCYVLFLRHSIDEEAVFASTETGTPVGDKVNKNIGPEGGSITSADGRLTVTVPENTLTETLAFNIQPVTNTFETGLGSSYRLEPEGKTFGTPVEISVHYDDHDLEGTFPEALSVAYQDKDGAWHMQPGIIELDKENKTVTLPATHFSIYAFIYLAKLSPAKATIRPGESIKIQSTYCSPLTLLVFPSFRKEKWNCQSAGTWALQGEGKLTSDYPDVVYTAPGKKPTPNIATVLFADDDAVIVVKVPRPCTLADNQYGIWGKNDEHEWMRVPTRCFNKVKMAPELDTIRSVITIVDRGYRASGKDGPFVYTGTVCNLEKPFEVTATNSFLTYPLKFDPTNGTSGTLSYNTTWKVLTMTGSGTYVIEGADTDTPKIVAQTKSTLSAMGRSSSGGGPAHIDLTPLDSNECDGK